jgi:hypothetical protein
VLSKRSTKAWDAAERAGVRERAAGQIFFWGGGRVNNLRIQTSSVRRIPTIKAGSGAGGRRFQVKEDVPFETSFKGLLESEEIGARTDLIGHGQ